MDVGSELIREPVRNAGMQMVFVLVSCFAHMKPSRCLAPWRNSVQAHMSVGLEGGGGGVVGIGGEGGFEGGGGDSGGGDGGG